MKASLLLSLVAALGVRSTEVQDLQSARDSSSWTVGQTVQTSSGLVNGGPAINQTEVSAYLGIPFAQPPIGDLRFAAPVKYNGTSPINGTKFGYSCPVKGTGEESIPPAAAISAANVTVAGLEIFTTFNTNGPYSEDCLTLNVWTKPQTGEAKKAVLVWIYGGGFSTGSTAYPGYNGANIAELEDVVVVSLNYRLSILGFPGNPSAPNNLALLDQRLAIEWIRDNVEQFGGDASRITLFGQSAGAASIDFYSYAWNSDPIAAGFIPESGTVFSWGLPRQKTASAAAWFNVTGTVGCGNETSDPATVLSCMRAKNSSEILNAIPASSGAASILGYFGPTVDDTIVFSNYSQKTPANIPMLLGNNDYEVGLFRTEFALVGSLLPDYAWDELDLQEFTCPSGVRANASVAASNPTWRYRYFGIFPNNNISSEGGAWHGAEMPLLFDTMPALPASTTEEIAFANYLRGAWAAFAKDPVKGLTTYGWPSYNASGDTLIRLGYEGKTGTNAVNPILYDANCVYVNVTSDIGSGIGNIPGTGVGTGNGTITGTNSSTSVSTTPSPTASTTTSATSAGATKNAGTKFAGSVSMVTGAFLVFSVVYLV